MKQFKLFGAIFLVTLGLGLMMLPSTRGTRELARRSECKHNLRLIALALQNYHDIYKSFPPAYTTDDLGNPLHSWRTLVLPFLDQPKLYESIDLSKPWNDPVNAEAYRTVVRDYVCPSAPVEATRTTYLALVTPTSVIRPIQSCRMSDITDRTENTLIVVEVSPEQAVHWMTPVDTDEQNLQALNLKTTLAHPGGRHGALVDGSVRLLRGAMPSEQIHALITVDGKEAVAKF